MVWHSARHFKFFDPDIKVVAVLHPHFYDYWGMQLQGYAEREGIDLTLAKGGSSRIKSVVSGLEVAVDVAAKHGGSAQDARVFIHDGARPFITTRMLKDSVKMVGKGTGAVPVVPVTDSLRERREDTTMTVDRSRFLAVQTPQVFMLDDIMRAYRLLNDEERLTDDASVAEKAGLRINTYDGDNRNIKITNPIDFIIAEAILAHNE